MPGGKPKIAYLIPAQILCGGVAVVCQHVNRLARRGFGACIVAVSPGGNLEWFPGQRVPVCTLSQVPRDCDIAVATWWETAHDLYRMKVPRKFYFVQSDETRFYPEGRYERIFARDSYWLEFEFFTEARWIQRWLKESFGAEARYVPNGIDVELFHPAEQLEPRGGRPRVLVEGPADMPGKGVDEAFRVLRGLDCDVWYVNYRGDPDPSWRMDRYFHAVPMSRMKHIYSSCDILLKMSTVEGSFGPPLEMMACGGACVVAKVTGMEEGIVDGRNALVVEPGDIAGAREAVGRLIDDRSLKEMLIANGRETVKRMDWEKSIDLLEDMFLSPPSPHSQRAQPLEERRAREREAVVIEAYGHLKREEKEHANALRERTEQLMRKDAEITALRHEIDRLNDELNSIYYSKQWKIALAFKEARHSLAALIKLPFRIMRQILP
jgi:glycosyltransferase involved in cell wall biosynthesis